MKGLDMSNIVIFFLIGFLFVFLIISLSIKELYMMTQWRKLRKEVEQINQENLTAHELLFEIEYIREQESLLYIKEQKLFPYLS